MPPELFPPTVLQNVTAYAIEIVCKTHPDYALAIRHITEYYDMKLAMFGLDSDGSMVVAFPVFIKDHASKLKTLYEIETVKVPIPDRNQEADSYSEVKYSKPYLVINDDYYIQLRIQELRMCKQIRHTYYCEELFLIKHKTKYSCESAIFYNLTCVGMWYIHFVSLTTFTIPQYHIVSLMEVQISSWLTCSALGGSFVQKIPHGLTFAQPPLRFSQQVNFMQLSFTNRPQLPPEVPKFLSLRSSFYHVFHY